MLFIIDKLKGETSLDQIASLLQKVIDNEIKFTISGLLIRTFKTAATKTPNRYPSTFVEQQLRF